MSGSPTLEVQSPCINVSSAKDNALALGDVQTNIRKRIFTNRKCYNSGRSVTYFTNLTEKIGNNPHILRKMLFITPEIN